MNITQPLQVGIISHSGMEVQRPKGFELIDILGGILGRFGRQVVLHHCRSSQADNIGRVFALNAGWQVEAHPAYRAAGMIPWRTAVLENQPEVVHPARVRADRDMEIIRASNLIVTVESGWGMPTGPVRKAETEGRAVIHIKHAKLNAPLTMPYSGVVHNWLVDEWR